MDPYICLFELDWWWSEGWSCISLDLTYFFFVNFTDTHLKYKSQGISKEFYCFSNVHIMGRGWSFFIADDERGGEIGNLEFRSKLIYQNAG
jgi:hypothetical protein